MYFARKIDGKIRLSIEGSQIINPRKNVIELKENQVKLWVMGNDIELDEKMENGEFYILKYKNNILGSGKYSDGKILNFVPKERRLKYVKL